MQNTALIAMSGGVDSSVAARLTRDAGFDCAGAIMSLYRGDGSPEQDARKIAERLGMPFYVFDFSKEFANHVIEPFIAAYRSGITPNPCIECNKHLKFGRFMEAADEIGKDYVVTGHYAQCGLDPGSGRYLLKKGADGSKDQSYVLYTLTQAQLSHTRFPLGGLTKREVREIALAEGLVNAEKPESQDICFVPDGKHDKFIEEYTGNSAPRGRFVDASGGDLGEHRGIIAYTVGQRRGLGLAMPHPPYVLEIKPEDNTVVIGKNEQLFSKTLTAGNINLIAAASLDSALRAQVKIRYKHTEQPATVRQTGSDTLQIEFDEPQRAITRGQAAVIYDGDIVIGGGTIV